LIAKGKVNGMTMNELERMNVVEMTAFGGPEVLKVTRRPRPAESDSEALIRLSWVGVNFVDMMTRTASFRHEGEPQPSLPLMLGVEGAGVVERLGIDVDYLHPGQRVGFVAHDARCYSEFATLPAHRLIPLPADIDDRQAAASLVTGLMAQVLLTEFIEVGPGVHVLVTGATGGNGSAITQWAAAMGAHVIAVVSGPGKVEHARADGAFAVIDLSSQDLANEVSRTTEGRGVDLALDAAGGRVFAQALDALATHGVIVPYGIAAGKQPPFAPLSLVDRSRRVQGVMLFDFLSGREELLRRASSVFEALRRGWLRPHIGSVWPLDQAAEAHRAFESRARSGKVRLDVSGGAS
jgi:NADPH2:quinone reductase